MTTMQLECFLAVTETLNFARAASQLNVTQPAVTQQIQALEEELCVKLFRRTTRMVQLTPEGQSFFDDARNILNMVHFTVKRFQEHVDDQRLLLSIGCHSSGDLELLPEVLRDMAGVYPELRPVFHTVPFQHLYQLLAEEAVDVILTFQEKREKTSYGIYREFTKTPVVAAFSREHPLAGKSSLTLEDLEQERMILIPPQKCPGGLYEIQHELMKNRTLSEQLFCETLRAGLVLVRAGYGAAIFPEFLVEKDLQVARVPLQGVEPLSYGAYYKSVADKPTLKLFLKLCKKYLGKSVTKL